MIHIDLLSTCLNAVASPQDWVWDSASSECPEAARLLEHVCQSVDAEAMALSEAELREWKQLQERHPEDILHGDELKEAVKVRRIRAGRQSIGQ